MSLDGNLQSALRMHTSEFMSRLSLDDAKNLAYVMWAAENLDGRELDEIMACNTSVAGVVTLLRLVRTRGELAIAGLAKALRAIERPELAEKISPSVACTSPALSEQSADGELRSNFRKLLPLLCHSLTLRSVHDVAQRMWSAKYLNGTELQAIMSCTEDFSAVARLTDYVYARGGPSIIGFAKALNDIEFPNLAKKIFPEVTTATGVTLTPQASDSSLGSNAKAAAATSLSDKLRHSSVEIAQRLTDGEIDGIIAVLRSTKEQYVTDLEYDNLKLVKGATKKALSIIHILLKKGDGAIQLFAKTLKDMKRQELSDKVLYGSASGNKIEIDG